MNAGVLTGYCSAAATRGYVQKQGASLPQAHYSHFRYTAPDAEAGEYLLLSSVGIGTFPGAATDEIDRNYTDIIGRALRSGLNVIDTATHYRYGRSMRAVAAGLRAAGIVRDAVFIVSKGGFLLYPDGPPADSAAWFAREIAERGLGRHEDLAGGNHLLSPAYISRQIELNLRTLGLATLDAFLVDQPEVHIPVIGKEAFLHKLLEVFVAMERAVRAGKIRYYGISTFHSLRGATDDASYLSLPSLVFLADKAAREVDSSHAAAHHFRVVQVPFNQVMTEAFARFNQVVGEDSEVPLLQAARRLNVYVMASHTLAKGHLRTHAADIVRRAMAGLAGDVQRAIQFNRSTPGLGTTLVGVSTPVHLTDLLAVSRQPPLSSQAYLAMYERNG